MSNDLQNKAIFQQIAGLLQNARQQVLRTVNSTMVYTYFEIGKIIVEEEQNGKDRAEYGKKLLKGLSKQLMEKFGKGFSVENLDRMRKFYKIYSISSTLSTKLKIEDSQQLSLVAEDPSPFLYNFKLTWSHYTFLMRVDDKNERRFYEIESEKHNWSLRELKRQYDSALYTRLSLSRDKEGILELSQKGQIIEKPKDLIKNDDPKAIAKEEAFVEKI